MFTHRCFLADVKDLWEEVKNRSGGIIIIFFCFLVFFVMFINSIKLFHIILVSGRPFIREDAAVPKTCVISFFPHLNPQGFSSWKSAGK